MSYSIRNKRPDSGSGRLPGIETDPMKGQLLALARSDFRGFFVIITKPQRCAPLAQLDRASGYEPEGREFESLRARHLLPVNMGPSSSAAGACRR